MLGLSHETTGELDEAVSEYTQELALNPKVGRLRLADAYCERAGARQKEKKDGAIADYEKSIDTGAGADGCSCDPYNPLFRLYTQGPAIRPGLGSGPQGRAPQSDREPEFLID
jgi:hypothetical protein